MFYLYLMFWIFSTVEIIFNQISECVWFVSPRFNHSNYVQSFMLQSKNVCMMKEKIASRRETEFFEYKHHKPWWMKLKKKQIFIKRKALAAVMVQKRVFLKKNFNHCYRFNANSIKRENIIDKEPFPPSPLPRRCVVIPRLSHTIFTIITMKPARFECV